MHRLDACVAWMQIAAAGHPHAVRRPVYSLDPIQNDELGSELAPRLTRTIWSLAYAEVA
jgi:hypothetical protein